jgi:hypothetical protein
MNYLTTEVEIVHNAYHHLWQQMRLHRLLRQVLLLVEQFAPIKTDKTNNRLIMNTI